MFNYYEGQSLLHQMNPVLKLASIGISMILLTFSFDPFVPVTLPGNPAHPVLLDGKCAVISDAERTASLCGTGLWLFYDAGAFPAKHR